MRDTATATHGPAGGGDHTRSGRREGSMFGTFGRRFVRGQATRPLLTILFALAFVIGTIAIPGVNASPVAGPLANLAVYDLATGGGATFAATSDGVFRTITGTEWTPWSLGLPTGRISALAFEATSQRLLAVAPSGLYVLPPGSTSWQSTAIAVAPSGNFTAISLYGPRLAYLGTSVGGVLKVDIVTATSLVIASPVARSTSISAILRAGDRLIVGDQASIWECAVGLDTCAIPAVPSAMDTGEVTRFASIQGTVFASTRKDGLYQRTGTGNPSWGPVNHNLTGPLTAMIATSSGLTVAETSNSGRSILRQAVWNPSVSIFNWTALTTTEVPETLALAPGNTAGSILAGTTSGPFLVTAGGATEVSDVGVVKTLTTTVTPTVGPTGTPAPTETPMPTETKTSTPTATVTPTMTATATATSAVPTKVPAAAAPMIKTRVASTAGGLAIASDGLASLAIPAGALTGDVDISMVPLVRPDPPGVIRYRSQLFYAQAVVDLSDTLSVTQAPVGQHPDETAFLAVAGSPYDVRVVDVGSGRELRVVPPSVEIGIVYRLEDLPRGTSEFGVFLGRWDELARTWVPLATRQNPEVRMVHASLTAPSIVAILIQAPVVVPTADGGRYVALTGQAISSPMVDAIAGAGGFGRTGLPIAQVTSAGAQLFQNARIEIDSTTGIAKFGNLGQDLVAATGLTFPETPDVGAIAGQRYFAATSRYVSDAMLSYYDMMNGAMSLGMPISPEIAEGPVFVQYFERGKLSIDPASLIVSIAPIGDDFAKLAKETAPVATAP